MYYNREPSRKTVTTAGDGGKFSSRRVAPSAVHVGSVYAGRGKCFRIPQVGIGCRRRWKRCQNLKRNAPAVPPPLWLWLDVSSLFHDRLSSVVSSPPPPLSSCLPLSSAPRFVMLIVSNSGHHRHVYFPFSSPFRFPSAHDTYSAPIPSPRAQSLVFVPPSLPY